MSRPLIFVLQFGGLIALLSGVGQTPQDWGLALLGLLAAIAGGIGYRNRKKG